ncbi:riboflavin kinase [Bacillus sp. JJ1773]|uniref:riboflavin kinase n=1 Tax=Bacillus sp. JJ1773 TaxID=3122965 RepID=UPI003000824D
MSTNITKSSLSKTEHHQTKKVISTITGKVVYGNQIGRTISFPTANLSIDTGHPFSRKGVYGVKIFLDDQQYTGVMNVGTRPTVHEEGLKLHYEVHILNFDQMIYGQVIKVDVCFFVREEMKFSSLEQLVGQIERDLVFVQKRFQGYRISKHVVLR